MRKDVAFASREFPVSERRACKLLAMGRSSYRYEPRPDHNAELRAALWNWRARSHSGVIACWAMR
jgi:hypothetical protein